MKIFCTLCVGALLCGCKQERHEWVLTEITNAFWITNIVLRSHDADVRMEWFYEKGSYSTFTAMTFTVVSKSPLAFYPTNPIQLEARELNPLNFGEPTVHTNQWMENGNSRVQTEFSYTSIPDWITPMLTIGTNGSITIRGPNP